MEEYQFDLSQFDDDISKANAVMSWLANRAFAYDKMRFNNIVLELNDDAIGAVAYEICKICTVFANTKFYTSKSAKKSRYFSKHGVVEAISRRKLNKLTAQDDTITWNATATVDGGVCDERPIIFYGFNSELLHFVATTLYGSKVLLFIVMWAARLEIIPVMILFWGIIRGFGWESVTKGHK